MKAVEFVSLEEQIYSLNRINNVYRGTLVEVHISDIHFGVSPLTPEYQYKLLTEQFTNKIAMIHFDILSIDGDLFDHKFMSNSDVVMYAIRFVNDLIELCKLRNATMVLIDGTKSHDAGQLKLFYHYLADPSIDIRIVEEVKFEYIKGAKVLCIPEVYGKDDVYYEQFLKTQQYDTIFMHGMIKGVVHGNPTEQKNHIRERIFTMEDFCYCLGPIISGHIHIPGCYNSHFYYNGSPMRFMFGEEQEKGFLIVLHNLDTHQYCVQLEPIKSFRYDTINLDHMLMSDPKQIIQYVNNLKQREGIEHLRIEFNKDFNEQEIANLELIKKYYKPDSSIKLKYEKTKTNQATKANQEFLEKYKEYDYILDKNLSEYEILCRYINQQKEYEYITVDELKQILEEDI
jgi:DNA repair exonuclease SbcCD nuclease subunit